MKTQNETKKMFLKLFFLIITIFSLIEMNAQASAWTFDNGTGNTRAHTLNLNNNRENSLSSIALRGKKQGDDVLISNTNKILTVLFPSKLNFYTGFSEIMSLETLYTKINTNLEVTPAPGALFSFNRIGGITVMGSNTKGPVLGTTLTVDGKVYISENGGVEKGFKNITSSDYKDYLLWVEKGIVSTDLAITTLNQWPDYVFAKDYKLNTLNELDAFITSNGHLPTMLPAKEIEKNGFTLSDMTKRTVKTIEELTLHTIEQHKILEKQAKLIETLEKRLNILESSK